MLTLPLKVHNGRFRTAEEPAALKEFLRYYLLEPQGSVPDDPGFGAGGIHGLPALPWGEPANPLLPLQRVANALKVRYPGLFLVTVTTESLPGTTGREGALSAGSRKRRVIEVELANYRGQKVRVELD